VSTKTIQSGGADVPKTRKCADVGKMQLLVLIKVQSLCLEYYVTEVRRINRGPEVLNETMQIWRDR
jgi:hypothetical protein